MAGDPVFRWHGWNAEQATKHGCSIEEIQSVVRNANRGFPKYILTGEAIDAMTDAQRAELVAQLDSETPQQRLARAKPLTSGQRETWRAIKKKIGRPKIGRGSQPISLTVEKTLLKKADEYAKRHGLKRAELVAQGLRVVIGEGK